MALKNTGDIEDKLKIVGAVALVAIGIIATIMILRGCDDRSTIERVESRSAEIAALKREVASRDSVIASLMAGKRLLELRYDSLQRISSKPSVIYHEQRRTYRHASASAAWAYLGIKPDSLWADPLGH